MYIQEKCYLTYIPQFSSSLSSSQSAWPSHLLEARTHRPELHLKWLGEHSVKSSGPYYCQQTENPEPSANLSIYMWDVVEKLSLNIRMVLHKAETVKVYLAFFCLPISIFPLHPWHHLFRSAVLCLYAFQQWTLFPNGQPNNCWSLKCPMKSMLLTTQLAYL